MGQRTEKFGENYVHTGKIYEIIYVKYFAIPELGFDFCMEFRMKTILSPQKIKYTMVCSIYYLIHITQRTTRKTNIDDGGGRGHRKHAQSLILNGNERRIKLSYKLQSIGCMEKQQ